MDSWAPDLAEVLGQLAARLPGLVKVARTLADLGGSEAIHPRHLAEALQYRTWPLD